MGGAVPALSDRARKSLILLAERASVAVEAQDAAAHLKVALRVYDALLDQCPNATLVKIARASLVPLTFRYQAALDTRIPNWELLAETWGRVREGFVSGDNVGAELAFEEMHRLPLPDREWEPAGWRPAEKTAE
jgi:hypothetical protein